MKAVQTFLMVMYLYTLCFGIFMTELFRVPAPLLFCCPLLFLFRDEKATKFLYTPEVVVLFVAGFLYSVMGLSDLTGFTANFMCLVICASFFNYYVGDSRERLNSAILIFMLFLTLSAVVMVLNHYYWQANMIRETLLTEKVIQTPSGIATTQFTFGYQLAALCPFAVIYTCVFEKSLFIKAVVFILCLVFLVLGMERSAFVSFICATMLFIALYYRFKAVIIIAATVIVCYGMYNYVMKDSLEGVDNIITKQENNEAQYNRTGLAAENLRIYSDYPYGLIFYGKNWSDVIYRNYVFSSGITSHNAYLMFFTYLGPFVGIGLLSAMYYKVAGIGLKLSSFIRNKDNAMLVCLCFAFVSVSINALSHNPWLLSANGPTIFLYFSIIHLYRQQKEGLN